MPNYVHLRGLPWSSTKDDIRNFFNGCNIEDGDNGISIIYLKNGRASGEAIVALSTEIDYKLALSKNKGYIGSRYIEVFPCDESKIPQKLSQTLQQSQNTNFNDTYDEFNEPIVRLRGLPYSCTKQDIENFFAPLQIIPNGITLAEEFSDKKTGEAYVQFINMEHAKKALEKHKQMIGHRYIEVFKSSLKEAKQFIFGGLYNTFKTQLNAVTSSSSHQHDNYSNGKDSRGNLKRKHMDDDYGRGKQSSSSRTPSKRVFISQTGFSIHMRGLPFDISEDEIREFFDPINPTRVCIEYNERNRTTGEADVDFSSANDAKEAMKYDRKHIKSRYIELFLEIIEKNPQTVSQQPPSLLDLDLTKPINPPTAMVPNYGYAYPPSLFSQIYSPYTQTQQPTYQSYTSASYSRQSSATTQPPPPPPPPLMPPQPVPPPPPTTDFATYQTNMMKNAKF